MRFLDRRDVERIERGRMLEARPPLRRVLRAFPSGAMCLDIVAEALLERLALRQAGQALGSSDVPTLTRINPSRDQVAGLLRPLAGIREASR